MSLIESKSLLLTIRFTIKLSENILENESYFFNKLPKIAQKIALHRIEREGDVYWLKQLDRTVYALAEKWELTLGEVLNGGTASLILEATQKDGRPAVLKLALPGNSIYTEALVLNATNGNGYVTLYDVDFEREALLLEKLGTPLSGTLKTIDEHILILCSTLRKSWVKPRLMNLPTAIHKALEMKEMIQQKWEELDRPFSERTLHLAMEYAEARMNAFDLNTSVLTHGDAHGFNILETSDGNYKFVDPDGVIADKAYDLICLMRDWSDELLAGNVLDRLRKRCTWLTELTGAEEIAIWQWGYLGRLVIGLTLMEIGKEDEGRKTLKVSDEISHHRVF